MDKIQQSIHATSQTVDILPVERGHECLVQFLVEPRRDKVTAMLVIFDFLVQSLLIFRFPLLQKFNQKFRSSLDINGLLDI